MDLTEAVTTAERRAAELSTLLKRGLTERIGVGHTLGMNVELMPEGRTVCTMTPTPALANAMLTVHGGILTTMLDTAMGAAIFLRLPDDTLYTTLELNTHFIRSVRLDDGELRCEGNALHVGRTTATAEARITDPEGRLVAHATCTCLVRSY